MLTLCCGVLNELNELFVEERISIRVFTELLLKWSFGILYRLRHEKTKIKRIDKGGPSDYQTLKWSPIVDPPKPDFPKHEVNRDDPFGSGMETEMITNSIKSFTSKQQAVSS